MIEECLKDTQIDYKIIANETNSGSVFEQWRKGLMLAKGDFIWICEADDIAHEKFLHQTISALMIQKLS